MNGAPWQSEGPVTKEPGSAVYAGTALETVTSGQCTLLRRCTRIDNIVDMVEQSAELRKAGAQSKAERLSVAGSPASLPSLVFGASRNITKAMTVLMVRIDLRY